MENLKSQLMRSLNPPTWYIPNHPPKDAREKRIWEEYGFSLSEKDWEFASQRAPREAVEIILDDLESGLA